MKTISSVAIMALVAQSSAFAPSHTSSSFIQKQQQLPSAYTPAGKLPSTSSSSRARSSSSSLNMNLFDRFARVAKANANNILQKMEDPEKILNQAVEDMQADLVKVRQSYAEVTATQRRLLKQKEQADALAADWYTRAQLALQKGNDELAREALSRRQAQTDEGANIQGQLDLQNSSIDKLYEGMQQLESAILDAKSKKEQMIARARTAESTQKVNDMLSGIGGNTSMDAFKRMEDKVNTLEASAEVSAEMGALNSGMLPGGSDLEKEFRMLEAGDAVDDELKKMKGLLGGSSDGASASASTSAAGGEKKSAVDDELEKLKRDAGL
mmetsp:Transcript_1795/g.2732  ORF Transcript_1795/g.2732 Transcript_1795/m.2732 type:complete len:326 (-) Transcript_1795:247-1224(-)